MTLNQRIAQYTRIEPDRNAFTFGKDITLEWDDPPIEFPTYIFTEWEPKWPVLMVPSGRGNPLVYSNDDKQTYYPQMPPLWWYQTFEGVDTHLIGESWRTDYGFVETALITYWNQTHSVDDQIQIEAGIWLVNDYYTDNNSNATDRAYKLAQLPKQRQGIQIPKLYQANSIATYNDYFKKYQDEGFNSVIVRPLDHTLGQPQHMISHTL